MASIAYVTDKNMIEFHRLNGNHTMNFWRLSSQRKFTHFAKGDYLFFLAKGSEHRITREKGIIGYGKLAFTKTMTFNQMWNEYGSLNGFSSREEFRETVLKVSKSKTIPKSMHSLYLEDIIFFKYPLYLSEININISANLESFFYLDRKGVSATTKILKKAQEIGIDAWQFALDDQINQQIFEKDLQNHVLSELINTIFQPKSTTARTLRQFIKEKSDYEFIKGSTDVIINPLSQHLIFNYEYKERTKDNQFYSLLGRIMAFKKLTQATAEIKDLIYQLSVISDQPIGDYQLDILSDYDIDGFTLEA